MSDNHSKSIVLSSLFWKLMERGGTQGIQFIVQIVLARLLAPEQFGTLAIVMVFITLAQVFVQSGFNTALIQKKDADETDFSSVFYLCFVNAGLLYIVIYFTAPFIAEFYDNLILIPVLRVLSLTLFFGAFNSIQNAYIARHLMFKKLFKSSLAGMLISAVFGILAAYQGLEVWALVIQQLVNQILITIIMWFTVEWRPRFVFSIDRVKGLFSYGWKLLASSLLNTLYMDLRTIIIGRIYTSDMLGYYNRGEQFPKLIVINIDGSIQSVMLPTLSAYQDNRERVKDMVRRSIMTSSFIIFPIMIGMAVVAESLVKIVLTEKWLPSVPFLQIFCVSYALMPIHTANLQAINALGRSDIFLKLEVIKKIIGLAILGVSLFFGVYAIALGGVLSGITSTFINAYPNSKLLNYSYKEQWKDVMPSLLISLVMGAIVYCINFIGLNSWITLVIQITLGAILYLGMAKLFRIECFDYLTNTFRELFLKKRKEM